MRRVRPADAATALVLAAWGLAESGGRPVVIAAVVLMTAPLAWRSQAPFAVAAAVAAGIALEGVAPDPPESLATLVAITVAAYTVASMGDPRRAAVGVALLVSAGFIEAALVGDGDYGFIAVVIGISAAAGYAMGTRGRQAEAELEREAERAVGAERERIARELHDSVAHAVSLMVVQAGAAETAVAGGGDAAKALERIRATGHEAVADLGRMVGLLRSEAVEPVYGIAQPERLVAPFRDAGLDVRLDVDGDPGELPAGLDGAAFRIAQEALTNALRHGAGSAALTIAYEPETLRLLVRNPIGAGVTAGTEHGITGMRERARLYGGDLRAEPNGNGTFEVEARLPLAGA
ncbi:MAG TPA: histidine kinase [Thermoleophilaceae bacterium]